ncbi:MAG: hypothetical protein JWL69_3647 [Phycisphaerales bacterium]|nr:hypothetical protein [Phycisphaerales bacterium]
MKSMRIIVSGRITARDARTNRPLAGGQLKSLDGIIYDKDVCSNYLDNDLLEIGLAGGSLRISYVTGRDELRVVTEYESPCELSAEELRKLVEDTKGQWSDGIGEGCFDDFERESGVHIDMAPLGMNQDVRVEQIDDGEEETDAAKATKKLLRAVDKGDLKSVMDAIRAGADVEAKKAGFPALHMAIGRSQIEIVHFLLENGAHVESLDLTGDVPLTMCAVVSTVNDADAAVMAGLLLKHGAEVNHDRNGWTPLDYAINRDKTALQRTLRGMGGVSKYYAMNIG